MLTLLLPAFLIMVMDVSWVILDATTPNKQQDMELKVTVIFGLRLKFDPF